MPLSVTHPFVNAKADGADATVVRPSDWNASHTLSGEASIAQGGTGAATAAAALTALGAVAKAGDTMTGALTNSASVNTDSLRAANGDGMLLKSGDYVHACTIASAIVMSMGGATDKTSYHNSDAHLFRDRAQAVNYATLNAIALAMQVPVGLKSYTVVGMPGAAAAGAGAMIYVSNEVGGAVPAFSDGTSWRRVTDRAVVT